MFYVGNLENYSSVSSSLIEISVTSHDTHLFHVFGMLALLFALGTLWSSQGGREPVCGRSGRRRAGAPGTGALRGESSVSASGPPSSLPEVGHIPPLCTGGRETQTAFITMALSRMSCPLGFGSFLFPMRWVLKARHNGRARGGEVLVR